MNYWHMQLHPNDRENWSEDDIWNILLDTKTIGLGEKWDNDRGQPEEFKKTMKIGDIVLIRPIFALIQVTSDWYTLGTEYVNHDKDWFSLRRNINFLSDNPPEDYKKFSKNIFNAQTLSIIKQSNEAYKYIDDWYQNI